MAEARDHGLSFSDASRRNDFKSVYNQIRRTGDAYKKQCAYCGANGKLTKEHVMPEWVGKRYFPEMRSENILKRIIHNHDESNLRKNITTSNSSLFTETIKKLCEKCNNRWSSNIIENAKTVILSIEKGTKKLLPEEANFLTDQAVLFFMNREFTDIPNQVTSFDSRKAFRFGREVRDFRVHVAIYQGHDFLNQHNQFSLVDSWMNLDDTRNPLVPLVGSASLIFSIGPVCFLVEYSEDYFGVDETKKFYNEVLPFVSISNLTSNLNLLVMTDQQLHEICERSPNRIDGTEYFDTRSPQS